MAEVIINYLLDRFAAYDMEYEEFQSPYERTFSYLNNLIFSTELFRTELFVSLGKPSYQLHDARTPFNKSLKEAKAQGKPAFASFGIGDRVGLSEDTLAEGNPNKGVSSLAVVTAGHEKRKEEMGVGKAGLFSSDRPADSHVDPFPTWLRPYFESRNPERNDWKLLAKNITKQVSEEGGTYLDKRFDTQLPGTEKFLERKLTLDFRKWTHADFLELLKETSIPRSFLQGASLSHGRDSFFGSEASLSKDEYGLRETDFSGVERRTEEVLLNSFRSFLAKADYGLNEAGHSFADKDFYGSHGMNPHSLAKDVPDLQESASRSLESGKGREFTPLEFFFLETGESSMEVREGFTLEKFLLSLFREWYTPALDSASEDAEILSGNQFYLGGRELTENIIGMADKDSAFKEYKDLGTETVRFTSGENKEVRVQEVQPSSDGKVKDINSVKAGSFITKIMKDPKDFGDMNFVGLSSLEKGVLVNAIDWILSKEAYEVQSVESVSILSKETYDMEATDGISILSKDAYEANIPLHQEKWFHRLLDFCESDAFQSAYREMKGVQDEGLEPTISLSKEAYGAKMGETLKLFKEAYGSDTADGEHFFSKDTPQSGMGEDRFIGKDSLLTTIAQVFSQQYEKVELEANTPFQDTSFLRGMTETWTEEEQQNLSKLLFAGEREGAVTLTGRGRELNPLSFNGTFLDKREYVIALAKELVAIDASVSGLTCEGFYVTVDKREGDIFQTAETSLDAVVKTTTTHKDDIGFTQRPKETTEAEAEIEYGSVIGDARDKEDGLRLDQRPKVTSLFEEEARIDEIISGSVTVPRPEDVAMEVKVGKNTIPEKDSLVIEIEKNIFQHQSNLPLVKLYRIIEEGGTLLLEQEGRATTYGRHTEKYLLEKKAVETHPELGRYVELAKILKNLHYDPQDDWVYNATDHDDMLNLGAGGIDELLLPQTDYNYASYREGLIDPVTLKPLKPVKELSDGSFVVERPVSHPLPEYKEIAKEYLDVNVNLLRHMILTYNKTWQQNIFKFGAMDMRDSVAKMLEFMDAYIQLEMPESLQPQAFRILRLIRWYGEASILKNAQYRVTYLYESLRGDFHTGESAIPYESANMHIDTKKFTLTNTVIGEESAITFLIENPIQTSIQMKVYQTDGLYEVFLNGESQGEFQGSPLELRFDLAKPEEGQKNELKLLYRGGDSGIINIANVVISDMVKADITTEYHPVVGSGNRILDELVKKVAIYADLYQNNESFFDDTIRGNLAITDLIQRLEDYFDLHHNRKSKGKRKTIRQS